MTSLQANIERNPESWHIGIYGKQNLTIVYQTLMRKYKIISLRTVESLIYNLPKKKENKEKRLPLFNSMRDIIYVELLLKLTGSSIRFH